MTVQSREPCTESKDLVGTSTVDLECPLAAFLEPSQPSGKFRPVVECRGRPEPENLRFGPANQVPGRWVQAKRCETQESITMTGSSISLTTAAQATASGPGVGTG